MFYFDVLLSSGFVCLCYLVVASGSLNVGCVLLCLYGWGLGCGVLLWVCYCYCLFAVFVG